MKSLHVKTKEAQALLGETLVLIVDPQKVDTYGYPSFMNRSFVRMLGFFIGKKRSEKFFKNLDHLFSPSGNWDCNVIKVEKIGRYKRMENLWKHRNNFRKSIWYKLAALQLILGRYFGQGMRYKKRSIKTFKELDAFFDKYLLGLFYSLNTDGYRMDIEQDMPEVSIGRNGEIIKSKSGRHRFVVARIVGVKTMPVLVSHIHPLWLEKMGGSMEGEGLERLKKALKELSAERVCK